MKRSKRYQEAAKKIDKTKAYKIADAIKLLKDTATASFDGSVEVHARLGIDTKQGDQQIRSAVVLPHGIGRTKKIAAFVSPDKEKDAKDADADLVGGESLIDKIKQTGKIEFELAIATPDMMPKMAGIAKILGPRGLMPSPKNETITTNLAKTISELKKGKISFKNDDTGNVHQIIGKVSFGEKQILENYQAFMDALKKAKPSGSKGIYLQNISLSSTMGPGIKVEIE